MADLPVWLLDVDGVLNAVRPGWGRAPRQGTASSGGLGYRMHWAPALIEEIIRLHRAGLVEIRWATTWADDIAQVERLLRLPRFPTAFSTLGVDPSVKAPERKAAAALEIVEVECRPLVWTDDDAIPASGPLIERLTAIGVPTMFVRPNPRHGLQPEDVRAIEEFLDELR
ncbi:hypothetical protein [Alloactinosynnema sp. L-07]|uniref:HAD domain-containing protein n=1 Tax=Alloactinosynnema sp. L-07 TaxID=1653480 RepID=UPI00065EFD4D|nr:HAD domain-containing protein [Alloactinosynnema sp. L-07]CRK60373.1 hypothetical protein [Alloactinosynnema sp. L-07]